MVSGKVWPQPDPVGRSEVWNVSDCPTNGNGGGGLGCDTLASVSHFLWAVPQEGDIWYPKQSPGEEEGQQRRDPVTSMAAWRWEPQRSKGDSHGTPTTFATVPVWGSLIDRCIFILYSSPTSSPSCWKTIHVCRRKSQVSRNSSLLKSSHYWIVSSRNVNSENGRTLRN